MIFLSAHRNVFLLLRTTSSVFELIEEGNCSATQLLFTCSVLFCAGLLSAFHNSVINMRRETKLEEYGSVMHSLDKNKNTPVFFLNYNNYLGNPKKNLRS